jgi:hypothetical protein
MNVDRRPLAAEHGMRHVGATVLTLPSNRDVGSTQRLPGLREARKRSKPDDDDQLLRY